MKATIFFRGREMAHPEIGHRILKRLIEDLADVAIARDDAAEGRQSDAHDPDAEARQQAGRAAPQGRRRQRRADGELETNMAKKMKLKTSPGRGQAVQEDRHRQVHAQPGVQASHPDEQDHQAEAHAPRNMRGLRLRAEQARAHAAVQIAARAVGLEARGLRRGLQASGPQAPRFASPSPVAGRSTGG